MTPVSHVLLPPDSNLRFLFLRCPIVWWHFKPKIRVQTTRLVSLIDDHPDMQPKVKYYDISPLDLKRTVEGYRGAILIHYNGKTFDIIKGNSVSLNLSLQ